MRRQSIILFCMIILLSSCSVNKLKTNNIYKQIANEGFSGLTYVFSDSGNRNIKVAFNNDSTINVTNTTNISQTYYALAFKCVYLYKLLDISSVYISSKLSCDRELGETKYLKPYDNKRFTIDNNAIEYVFPDIKGDTIRFSPDFRRLQIKEFSFDLINK